MKKPVLFLLGCILAGLHMTYAQVSVNTSGNPPDLSAMLDVSSLSRGILIPRMTFDQRNGITLPASGLLIYQTDGTWGFYYNSGTPLSPDWKIVGHNAGTFSQWVAAGSSIYYNQGSIGIGTNAPIGKLHIVGSEDISQFSIDANSTQSNTQPLVKLRNSAGLELLHIHSDAPANTFIGLNAGRSNNYLPTWYGEHNTFIGSEAGYSNTDGNNNTAVGFNSLQNNSTGTSNTGLGYMSLANSTGNSNTGAGSLALFLNNTGNYNAAFGTLALLNNTVGTNNTAVGTGALVMNMAGSNATAVGYNAMYYANNNEVGFVNHNIAIGYEALRGSINPSVNTGNFNIAMGYQSLLNNTSGNNNISIGDHAGYLNSTGSDNLSIGHDALYTNASGNYNTAVGNGALATSSTTSFNSGFGFRALYVSFGSNNSAFGYHALFSSTSGSYNAAAGARALYSNTIGNYNVAAGREALYFNSTGSDNTAIGDIAGYGAPGVNFTSCTFLGSTSYPTVGRSNVTMVGAYISNGQCTGDNQVLLGNTSIAQIRAQVTSITAYSDGRFKTDVRDDVPGLSFIMNLRPVTYNVRPAELHRIWGTPDSVVSKIDHTQVENTRYIGFIGQDVEEAADEIGFEFPGIDVPKNNEEVYTLRYVDFIMPLVKAVQEQQEEIEILKAENLVLKERLDQLEIK